LHNFTIINVTTAQGCSILQAVDQTEASMAMNSYAEPHLYREAPTPQGATRSSSKAEAALEFGRFRVLLRRRQLVADGVPIELGTRAFDLLVVLLEADGSLVSKDELLGRVWPGVFVTPDNLKFQISALRKAFGEDRDFIRTECGRGYRFIAAVRSTPALSACQSATRRGHRSTQRFPRWTSCRPSHGWCVTPAYALILLTPGSRIVSELD
jgi:DNA-binding winged helix-turn-helix (wHTH) protein